MWCLLRFRISLYQMSLLAIPDIWTQKYKSHNQNQGQLSCWKKTTDWDCSILSVRTILYYTCFIRVVKMRTDLLLGLWNWVWISTICQVRSYKVRLKSSDIWINLPPKTWKSCYLAVFSILVDRLTCSWSLVEERPREMSLRLQTSSSFAWRF